MPVNPILNPKQPPAQAGKGDLKMKYTVRLDDNTIGTINDNTIDGQHADAFIGEIVNVHLHDENGNAIEKEGKLVEVLEESIY